MAILNHKQALENFKFILKKLPNDKLTLENYKQCTNYLKRQAFEKAIAGNDDNESIFNKIDYQSIQIEKSWSGPELNITTTTTTKQQLQQQPQPLEIIIIIKIRCDCEY